MHHLTGFFVIHFNLLNMAILTAAHIQKIVSTYTYTFKKTNMEMCRCEHDKFKTCIRYSRLIFNCSRILHATASEVLF